MRQSIDRASVFTRPDITENSLRLVNASIEHELSDRLSLSGNVHFRSSDIDSLNGDDSDRLLPDTDPRIVTGTLHADSLGPQDFCYVRVLTEKGNLAWSSPVWGDEL